MQAALLKAIIADERSSGIDDQERRTALCELYGYNDNNLTAGTKLYLEHREFYWGL